MQSDFGQIEILKMTKNLFFGFGKTGLEIISRNAQLVVMKIFKIGVWANENLENDQKPVFRFRKTRLETLPGNAIGFWPNRNLKNDQKRFFGFGKTGLETLPGNEKLMAMKIFKTGVWANENLKKDQKPVFRFRKNRVGNNIKK